MKHKIAAIFTSLALVSSFAIAGQGQIGRFDLGYGTHINEFGAFSGNLTLNYRLSDPNFQGRVKLVIGIK